MNPDPNTTDLRFDLTYLIILTLLLILSAYFSCSETAYTSINMIKLERQAKTSKSARLAMKLSENYDRLLSTILVGNNIVNITGATMATIFFVKHIGEDLGSTVSTIVFTMIVLIFGEITPKSIARVKPELFAKLNSYSLYVFSIILFPIVWLLSQIQKLFRIIFKSEESRHLNEEEFSMLVEDMNEEGVINDIEENIIQKTIEYGDIKVKEVMTPSKNVVFIKDSDSIEAIKKKFADSDYSRLVVCKTNSINSAYGIIHQKDLFKFLVENGTDLKSIIIADAIISKPTHKISRLLKRFQSDRQHMSIVKDGSKVVGIVTMEDILEELVGEIKDENDDD